MPQHPLQSRAVASDCAVDELNTWAPQLVQKLQALPELRDVASDQQDRGLQAALVIDRNTASRLGITSQAIDDTLYDAFGQRQVSTIFTQLNQYHVVLEVTPNLQLDPGSLKDIYVKSATAPQAPGAGEQTSATNAQPSAGNAQQSPAEIPQVPLSAFSHFEQRTTPLAINHQGQFPAVTLSFNLAPGFALGDAVKAIEQAKQEIGMPASIQASFQGTAEAFRASLTNERC
jgi:multidrug efflux pump